MTWLAQVGHVARKDMRQFWWLILLYVALVAVVTATALSDATGNSLIVSLDAFIVVAFGMAAAATLVQSDSPSRSNAFWPTRPLDPSAVFAAKLLIALGVIGVGVLGEVVGLNALDLGGHVIGSLVMRSIGLYAIWLAAAITIAAFTRDFRTFAITLFIALIAFLALAQILVFDKYGPLHLSAWIPAVGVVVALGALAHRYQRRDSPSAVWGIAVVGLCSAFLFLLSKAEDNTGKEAASTEFTRASLIGSASIVNHDQLVLHLRAVNGDSGHSYIFMCDTLIAHLVDGSALPLEPRFGTTNLQRATLPGVGGVNWLHESRIQNIGVASYGLDNEERVALARGVSAIDLAGQVSEYLPELTAQLPLRTGQSIARGGTRVRIGKVLYGPDSLSVELERASVAKPHSFELSGGEVLDPFTWGGERPNFALVNRVRGEAMMLHSRANEMSNGWVVLPGAPIQQSTTRLAPTRVSFGRDSIPRDRAWYSDSQLFLFSWKPSGTYRVHARIAVQ